MEKNCSEYGKKYISEHADYSMDDVYFYLEGQGFAQQDIVFFITELGKNETAIQRSIEFQKQVGAINILSIDKPFDLPTYILEEIKGR